MDLLKVDEVSFQADIDGDGVDDVIVLDTNGHTAYINVRTVLKYVVAAVTAIGTIAFGMLQL